MRIRRALKQPIWTISARTCVPKYLPLKSLTKNSMHAVVGALRLLVEQLGVDRLGQLHSERAVDLLLHLSLPQLGRGDDGGARLRS